MANRRGGLATVGVVVLACAAIGNDAGSGWVNLFDGKTLDGWTAEHTDKFSVRDGVIVQDGGTGWLRAAKPYKDFELQAEYRVVKPGGDSGLFFRASVECTPQAPHWPVKGYQLQVIDGPGNLLVFGHGTPPPKCDRKTDALKTAMKGPGAWQALILKVVDKRAEATLNGTPITISDAIGLPEGTIGLQAENGHFEWRNLKIKMLPSP